MRRLIPDICKNALAILVLGMAGGPGFAQDSTKSPLVVNLSYFSTNNTVPSLSVTAKTKTDGKFQPVKGMEVTLYLDKDSSGKGLGLIGKVVTNEKGMAATIINPTLAAIWKAAPNHTFIALTDNTKQFDETKTEISIAKARIVIDTAEDKNVVATVSEYKGGAWVPVKGVDVKMGIVRLASDLPISDKDSYTTDSLGQVKGEFKHPGMPGDTKGNILLVAKVEDNDQYGNLRIEKSVNWGKPFVAKNVLDERALWGAHFKTPYWLLFMAYSIVLTVWGTLIYLVALLFKIKKLGRAEQ